MATDTYDIAIVGGGPAGLSAAIWSARYLHSVVLVDSAAPRNWETRRINGYLGLPGIRPPQMRELGRREARDLGVSLLDGGVLRVERDSSHDAFSVALEGVEPVAVRTDVRVCPVDLRQAGNVGPNVADPERE
jgi:thioredoxin reductase